MLSISLCYQLVNVIIRFIWLIFQRPFGNSIAKKAGQFSFTYCNQINLAPLSSTNCNRSIFVLPFQVKFSPWIVPLMLLSVIVIKWAWPKVITLSNFRVAFFKLNFSHELRRKIIEAESSLWSKVQRCSRRNLRGGPRGWIWYFGFNVEIKVEKLIEMSYILLKYGINSCWNKEYCCL